MTIATLRTKATLELMLSHSQQRSRDARGILGQIDALLTLGLPLERLHAEIRAEMERLQVMDAEAQTRYAAAGKRVDAARYPDETE